MLKHERELAMKLMKEVQREWGRQGGKKGSAMLTPAQRKRKAKRAAEARWNKTRERNAVSQSK